MRTIRVLLAAFAALILTKGVLPADTESFLYILPSTSTGTTTAFTLPGFNPSLGTLTGVTLTLDLSTISAPFVYNPDGSSASFTNASVSFTTTVNAPDGADISILSQSNNYSGTAIPGGNLLSPATTKILSGTDDVSPSNFSLYTSSSPLDFTVGALTQTSAGTSSDVHLLFGGSSSLSGDFTVEYDYTPSTEAVPEPSTYALLLAGMTGLVFFARRRRLGL